MSAISKHAKTFEQSSEKATRTKNLDKPFVTNKLCLVLGFIVAIINLIIIIRGNLENDES